MVSSRAQGSIEYLVIIAVIVAISLVVTGLAVAMFKSPASTVSVSSSALGSRVGGGVGITEGVVDRDGNSIIRLLNNTGNHILISKISVSGIDSNYSGAYLPRGGSATFSLDSLGSTCACVTGETTHTCAFTITITSDTGLAKTQTLNKTLDCVNSAITGTGMITPVHSMYSAP